MTGTNAGPDDSPGTDIGDIPKNRKVFVVHGRDEPARLAICGFLAEIGLRPLDWEELVRRSGAGTPYLGDVVRLGFDEAQAAVVLLTPDDVAHLHPDLKAKRGPSSELLPAGQPRQNVLFELGMAFAVNRANTIVVEMGRLRPFSDAEGLNTIRLDGSAERLQKLVLRLKTAGCDVNMSGAGYLNLTRFDLKTYVRRPKRRCLLWKLISAVSVAALTIALIVGAVLWPTSADGRTGSKGPEPEVVYLDTLLPRSDTWVSGGMRSMGTFDYERSVIVLCAPRCCPPSRLTLEIPLDRKYKRFNAVAGVANSDTSNITTAEFFVRLDGDRTVFSTDMIGYGPGRRAEDISVENATKLELIVVPKSCGSNYLWADARLTR